MSLALYELASQYRSLKELQDADDVPPEVIADTLESLEGDIQDKCVAISHVILNLQAAGEAIVKAAQTREARGKSLLKRADMLKAYMLLHMQAVEISKVHHEDFDIRRQNSPKTVVIDDETRVPDEYWVQPDAPPKRIDKEKIADAYKAGLEVEGTHSFQGEHIRIAL